MVRSSCAFSTVFESDPFKKLMRENNITSVFGYMDCGSQFRCSKIISGFMNKFTKHFNPDTIEVNFFGERNGKGLSDVGGALLKRNVRFLEKDTTVPDG